MPGGREIRAGKAFVEMGLRDRLSRGLKRARAQLLTFGRSVTDIGRRLATVGAAAAVPFAAATRIFTGFSDKMLEVKAVTGANEDQFKKLNDQAKLLGRTTSFTAAQVAGAMAELGRAGFQPDQIESAIAAVLDLARASGTELPRAAEIAAATLRGFNLSADDTRRVADILTATVNNSSQNMEDLGEAMKFVAPIALEAGESLEDTAAALGVLANNAIKGSLAGNSLARAYKNLSNQRIAKEVEDLGVAVTDARGNLRPLATILTELGEKTRNLGSGQRLSIFETIFGRGQAAALKLASPTAKFADLQKVISGTDDAAATAAKTMDSGLGGAFRRLLSAVEGVAIAVGESLADALSKVADGISAAAGFITRLINKNKDLILTAAKVVAVVLAMGVGLLTFGALVSGVGFVLGSIATVVSGVATAIGILGSAIAALVSPIGLAITAVVSLGVVILHSTGAGADALRWLADRFNDLKDDALKAFRGIKDALAAGDIRLAARILWLTLKVQFEKGIAALKSAWESFRGFFVKIASDAFFGALIVLNDAWASMQKAWVETTTFLANAWTTFTGGLNKVWNNTQNSVEKGWLKLMGLFDDTLDVEGALKLADEDLARRNKKVDVDAQAIIADREKVRLDKRKKIEDERVQTLKVIVDKADAAERDRQKRQAAAIKKSEDDLKKARDQWQAAIKQAAQQRAAVGQPKGAEGPTGPKDATSLIDQVKQQLTGLGQKLNETADRSTRGVFNAEAIQSLQTTPGREELERLRQIEEHTRDMVRRLQRAVFTFE